MVKINVIKILSLFAITGLSCSVKDNSSLFELMQNSRTMGQLQDPGSMQFRMYSLICISVIVLNHYVIPNLFGFYYIFECAKLLVFGCILYSLQRDNFDSCRIGLDAIINLYRAIKQDLDQIKKLIVKSIEQSTAREIVLSFMEKFSITNNPLSEYMPYIYVAIKSLIIFYFMMHTSIVCGISACFLLTNQMDKYPVILQYSTILLISIALINPVIFILNLTISFISDYKLIILALIPIPTFACSEGDQKFSVYCLLLIFEFCLPFVALFAIIIWFLLNQPNSTEAISPRATNDITFRNVTASVSNAASA